MLAVYIVAATALVLLMIHSDIDAKSDIAKLYVMIGFVFALPAIMFWLTMAEHIGDNIATKLEGGLNRITDGEWSEV